MVVPSPPLSFSTTSLSRSFFVASRSATRWSKLIRKIAMTCHRSNQIRKTDLPEVAPSYRKAQPPYQSESGSCSIQSGRLPHWDPIKTTKSWHSNHQNQKSSQPSKSKSNNTDLRNLTSDNEKRGLWIQISHFHCRKNKTKTSVRSNLFHRLHGLQKSPRDALPSLTWSDQEQQLPAGASRPSRRPLGVRDDRM